MDQYWVSGGASAYPSAGDQIICSLYISARDIAMCTLNWIYLERGSSGRINIFIFAEGYLLTFKVDSREMIVHIAANTTNHRKTARILSINTLIT